MSERKKAISVIVPVYKVEPYLHYCIDSILAQTFTDFELILVDDGSPDNCGAICDEYATKDDRIVVIHQENGGLSAARNTGIDWVFANSDSQWITFVDSDDVIGDLCLGTIYECAITTNADVVCSKGYYFSEDFELRSMPKEANVLACMSGRESCISFYQNGNAVSVYSWGKLYRRALFSTIRFPIGKLYEDEAVTPKILYNCSRVVVLDAWLYGYRQRQDSIVHVPFNLHRFDHIEGLDSCIRFLKEKNEKEIVMLAEKRKRKYVAKYILLAHGAKLTSGVPKEYRMSVWRAFWITLEDTLQNGGIKHIFVRLRQFILRTRR